VREALVRLRDGRADGAAGAMPDPRQMSREQLFDGLFQPGLSTERMITDVSGRGVGLDVVRSAVADLKGHLSIHAEPDQGLRLTLELPITLATTRILLLQVGEREVGLPMDLVTKLFRFPGEALYRIEGQLALEHQGEALAALPLARVFDPVERPGAELPDRCVVIAQGSRRLGLLVDGIGGAEEVLLRPLAGVLRRLPGISGSSILSNGRICPVLNAADLLGRGAEPAPATTQPAATPARTLLLVEDSMVTRVQEKRLLESAGYRVVTAVDGIDALAALERGPGERRIDGVVSDINMPRMDGLRLTEHIRGEPRLKHLPVVLVTTLASDRDRRRGLDAGADAYITKAGFDNRLLLSTLERLL
jgi:two-component system chemotaxis sensor kinase CheA